MEEQIRIERLGHGSAGIGHTDSGKTIFIDKVAPGDLVIARITEEKPRFCVGQMTEIIEAGPSRTSPPCSYYNCCGACSWQHIKYPIQQEAKRANVIAALTKTAHFEEEQAQKIVAEVKPSKREFGYRNKLELGAQYSAQDGFQLGLRRESSHDLTEIDACLLAHKAIEKAPRAVRGALKYLQGNQDLGIFRVGIRHSMRTNDTEIALWTRPGAFPRKAVAQTLRSALPTTSIARVIADPGKARVIKQVEALDGKGYWEEKLHDYRFRTSAPSFFQVNTAQAEVLVDEVLAGLELGTDSVVADLYAGGGTFSLALAKRAELVFAVESSSSSVKDLRRNADLNHVPLEVIGGDSTRELPTLGSLDALVVDPPRAGLTELTIENIAQAGPQGLAYVSCDPATWARDVARLQAQGYQLSQVQPVDLFPQTYHIELVSIFKKMNP